MENLSKKGKKTSYTLWYNLAAEKSKRERSRSLAYRARLECV